LPLSDTPSRSFLADAALRALPAVLAISVACRLAWFESGTIASRDWLGYALLGGLLLVTVLTAGRVYVPARLSGSGTFALVALAAWCAVSLSWSPLPTLGREEVLLVAFYAVVLAFPLLLSTRDLDRWIVLAALVIGVGLISVASAQELRTDPDESMFRFGRLIFPVSYVNANAAFFLVGLWPAVAIAAVRAAPALLRAGAVAVAGGVLAGWLATQSKGGGLGLAVSAAVLFAVSPLRLRLLLPLLLGAASAAAAYVPLTAPFRAQDAGLTDAAREAGGAWLVVIAAGFAVGLVYALMDRRVTVGPRVRRAAGAAVLGALALALLGATIGFFVSVDDPVAYAERKIDQLKGVPSGGEGTSHFETLESERYDVWRVALREFSDHPVTGIGARGFYASYLEHGRSIETPARAHSLPLDALAETGVVGLALLVIALGGPLVVAAREARASLAACAAFAACVYWLAHAAVDWIWTLPACGIVFFTLLGIAAAGRNRTLMRPRVSVALSLAVALVPLVVFAPAWLASRYVKRALDQPVAAARVDLDRARRLDPISTTTFVVEAQLASEAAGRIDPLRRAVEKEPRSAGLHLLLGVAYRDSGRVAAARRELEIAQRLAPRNQEIQRLLRDLR
jgi:O-antigen ligase/polysaccharide polymerase Wzy-like membrane protein